MTTLNTLFGKVRQNYLMALNKEIEVYNQTFVHTSVEELIQQASSQHIPAAYQLHRVDMVSNSNNYTDFTEFHTTNTVFFKPTTVQITPTTKLQLEPFLWNEVDIECLGVDTNAGAIQNWFYRWVNEQGSAQDCPFNLKGCVHGITVPPIRTKNNRFSIDLGSAKETALLELLQVLTQLKAKKIRVYSRSLYL